MSLGPDGTPWHLHPGWTQLHTSPAALPDLPQPLGKKRGIVGIQDGDVINKDSRVAVQPELGSISDPLPLYYLFGGILKKNRHNFGFALPWAGPHQAPFL